MDGESGRPLHLVGRYGQRQPGKTAHEAADRLRCLQAGQRRAETEVNSETEGNMETKITTDVERVRLRVGALVSTSRTGQ